MVRAAVVLTDDPRDGIPSDDAGQRTGRVDAPFADEILERSAEPFRERDLETPLRTVQCRVRDDTAKRTLQRDLRLTMIHLLVQWQAERKRDEFLEFFGGFGFPPHIFSTSALMTESSFTSRST